MTRNCKPQGTRGPAEDLKKRRGVSAGKSLVRRGKLDNAEPVRYGTSKMKKKKKGSPRSGLVSHPRNPLERAKGEGKAPSGKRQKKKPVKQKKKKTMRRGYNPSRER